MAYYRKQRFDPEKVRRFCENAKLSDGTKPLREYWKIEWLDLMPLLEVWKEAIEREEMAEDGEAGEADRRESYEIQNAVAAAILRLLFYGFTGIEKAPRREYPAAVSKLYRRLKLEIEKDISNFLQRMEEYSSANRYRRESGGGDEYEDSPKRKRDNFWQ